YLESSQQLIPLGFAGIPLATSWTIVSAQVTVPTWNGVDGETLFYWDGLYNGYDFIQPVLQWGPAETAGFSGGNFWTIGSWAWRGETAANSPLLLVNPGDQLMLYMFLAGVNGSTYTFEIIAADQTTGQWTGGAWNTTNGALPLAYPAVLETSN